MVKPMDNWVASYEHGRFTSRGPRRVRGVTNRLNVRRSVPTPKKITDESVLAAIRDRSYAHLDPITSELGLPNDCITSRQRVEKIINNLVGRGKVIPVDFVGQQVEINEYGYRVADGD